MSVLGFVLGQVFFVIVFSIDEIHREKLWEKKKEKMRTAIKLRHEVENTICRIHRLKGVFMPVK